MKSLNLITLNNDKGEVIREAGTDRELNTLTLIMALFNNVKYRSRDEQRRADKIYIKLEELLKINDLQEFELEDAEFELVQSYVREFEPYLTGRTFLPFLDELDKANHA